MTVSSSHQTQFAKYTDLLKNYILLPFHSLAVYSLSVMFDTQPVNVSLQLTEILTIPFFAFRDTLIVAFGNIGTSLFAGFVIFAIIGYLAQELNMKVEEVVDQGRFIVEY